MERQRLLIEVFKFFSQDSSVFCGARSCGLFRVGQGSTALRVAGPRSVGLVEPFLRRDQVCRAVPN